MKQFQYVITDPLGIHARPAGMLTKMAKTLDSTIMIEKVGGGCTSATKIMALMGLCIKCNDQVTITVEGGDEELNFQKIEAFFKDNL